MVSVVLTLDAQMLCFTIDRYSDIDRHLEFDRHLEIDSQTDNIFMDCNTISEIVFHNIVGLFDGCSSRVTLHRYPKNFLTSRKIVD